jgi:hypothetical protein
VASRAGAQGHAMTTEMSVRQPCGPTSTARRPAGALVLTAGVVPAGLLLFTAASTTASVAGADTPFPEALVFSALLVL